MCMICEMRRTACVSVCVCASVCEYALIYLSCFWHLSIFELDCESLFMGFAGISMLPVCANYWALHVKHYTCREKNKNAFAFDLFGQIMNIGKIRRQHRKTQHTHTHTSVSIQN